MVDDSRHRTKLFLETYIIAGNLTKDNDYPSGTTGNADSGTTIIMIDAERTEGDDYWLDYYIKFGSGLNQGCERKVTHFVAATDTMTFLAFNNAVSAGDSYVLNLTSTAVSYIVAYGLPNYPLTRVFVDKGVDLIFSIGEPIAEPLFNTDQVPFNYEEHVPITVFTVDKTGITGTELKNKAEVELKRLCETYPTGSQRSMERIGDKDLIIGKTIIYGTEWTLNYRRDTAT